MNILRVIKKVIAGESVVVVRQDQDHWDRQFARGKWRVTEELSRQTGVIANIINAEAKQRKVRVLDVGCGSGVLGTYLWLQGGSIEYHGTDISEEALSQAKERVPAGTYYCRDMEDDPAVEGDFDFVVFSEVLLYADFEKALAAHRSYLKEGGTLIISLYQTLRTKYIWQKISHLLEVKDDVYVKDMVRNIAWRVRTCQYRNE